MSGRELKPYFTGPFLTIVCIFLPDEGDSGCESITIEDCFLPKAPSFGFRKLLEEDAKLALDDFSESLRFSSLSLDTKNLCLLC